MDDSESRTATTRRTFLAAGGALAFATPVAGHTTQRAQSNRTWPGFQLGAENTGVISDTAGLVTNVDESTQLQTGNPVRVQPIVADGTVYLSSTVLNGDGGAIAAFDTQSGRQRWRIDDSAGVLSTPTVVGERLLVVRLDELVALSTADGSQLWTASLLPSGFSSPTARDGTVYVGTRTGTVSAVDSRSGDLLWETTVASGATVNTTPAVGPDRVYVGAENDTVYALNKQGIETWSRSFSAPVRAAPTLGAESLFVATTAGTLHALDPARGSEEWQVAYDASTASSPAVADGTLYWATESTLTALAAADGTERWTVETSGFSGLNNIAPSPIRVGDVVYVTTGHTSAYAVDAETGTERWTFTPGSDATVLAITVTGDRAYVASDQGNVHVLTGETNIAPSGSITFLPQNPAPGDKVTLDAGRSSDLDGTVRSYEWDLNEDSEFERSGERVTRTFESAGTYQIALRVTDDAGRSVTKRRDIIIDASKTTTERASGGKLGEYVERVPGGMAGIGTAGGTVGLSILALFIRRLRSDESSPSTDSQPTGSDPTLDTGSDKHIFTGTRYDAYETGKQLRVDGRTRVVRATLDGHDDAVALCTVRNDTSNTIDSTVLGRFIDGLEAWSTIDDHDNILTVYAWDETPAPWAALELADGRFDPQAFSDSSLEQKRELVRQLCEAVHHGHRYGLVHGSLDPNTVLYVDDGNPSIRVSDWGITSSALSDQATTQKQDIEDIAALTYELFTGQRAPTDPSVHDFTVQDAGYPTALSEVFETVWQGSGYDTALHLRDALDRVL